MLLWPPAAAEAKPDAVAGACDVTLTLTGNVSLVPPGLPGAPFTATTLAVNGGGSCWVNGVIVTYTLTIGGSVSSAQNTATWSCLGGVASGQLAFNVTHPDFPSGVQPTVVIAAVGPAMSFTGVDDDPRFFAEGALVQDTPSTLTCPTAGDTSSTWKGYLVFAAEDVIPVPTVSSG